jgi:hypothetical protein
MAKQLKQYTRVSDIDVGDAGVARGYSRAPTMPMLTYAAEELPVRVTSDTCDMYLVAAAKDGDHQAYADLCPRHPQLSRTVLRITGNVADAESKWPKNRLSGQVVAERG